MTFKTKLPIRKSKQDIEFYLKHGPIFGKILLNLYNGIINKEVDSMFDLEGEFHSLCIQEFNLEPGTEYLSFITQKNAYGKEFGEAICVSINDCVAHGRTNKIFKQDSIISVDCGLKVEGLHFDGAFTVQISNKEDWVKAPHRALQSIATRQPENTYELGSVIEDTCYWHELSNVVSLTGHGIGYNLHEPPSIHNAKGDYIREEIFEGLCFCAEPIFAKRKNNNKLIERTCIDSDGWAIFTQSGVPTSHFETMYCKHEGRIVDLLKMTEWLI